MFDKYLIVDDSLRNVEEGGAVQAVVGDLGHQRTAIDAVPGRTGKWPMIRIATDPTGPWIRYRT